MRSRHGYGLAVAAVLAALGAAAAAAATLGAGPGRAAAPVGAASARSPTRLTPWLAAATGRWFIRIGRSGPRMTLLGRAPLVVALAPDGSQVAVALHRKILFVSRGAVRIVAALAASPAAAGLLPEYQPVAWSPASDKIAVTLQLRGKGKYPQPWAAAVSAASGKVTVLAKGIAAAWSSDGRALALLRLSQTPPPCDDKMNCPHTGVFIWSGGSVRRLVSARQLWKSGMGENWPIAWDSRTGKIFFDTIVGYDSGMLVARRASDGRMLWHMVGDFAQQVAPGIFGLAQRGYDTANEITTYAPLLVNENGKVLRRYPPVDHALHYGMPAWSHNLRYLARERQDNTNSVVISGPGAYRWKWEAKPPGASICGYYWLAPKSLVVWTELPTSRGEVTSEAWWLETGDRAARRLLTVTAPARASGSPGNATSVCGTPTQGGAIWPAAPGWG